MIYPLPNPDGTNADRRVEVGWSRDRYVAVATTRVSAKQPGDGETLWDEGQHVDLNREQINELIRVLRRARDQAFGRDE
jgi:hypothetical protein